MPLATDVTAAQDATPTSWRWAVVPLLAGVLAVSVTLLPDEVGGAARAALLAFGLAVLLWSATPLPAAWVALVAVLVLVALGGAEQDVVYGTLGSDVVWLMVGAFVLGGAVRTTGLADRLTAAVLSRTRTVGGTFWAVTALLVPLSAVVPSTSGRAALMLPVHRAVADRAGDRGVSRALALLIPSVVLVSTICTLVGAGSHLVVDDLLHAATGERISFAQWLLWGAPVGVLASAATCWVVLHLHLDGERRRAPLRLPSAPRRPWSSPEVRAAVVAAAMVALWCTEPLHGVEIAVVAVAGALALTAPGVGVLSWRRGLDEVSWNLVVFVGAALVLGGAMIDTGAAGWLVGSLFEASGLEPGGPDLLALVVVAVIALTSHLYMTSHAARAAALVPAVLVVAQSLGLDPVATAFVATVGMDYCLTLPVSSKALLMYADLDDHPLVPADLARLSAVMLPVHLVLVVVLALAYWPHVGLTL